MATNASQPNDGGLPVAGAPAAHAGGEALGVLQRGHQWSFQRLQLQVEGIVRGIAKAQAPAGCERERVIEGRERVCACDVELEFVLEP